jgi:hypothetical protein
MQKRLWWGLANYTSGEDLESGGRFCIDAFGRKLALVVVEDVSNFNSLSKDFYKCCTCNVICKDNAGINCITTRHRGKFRRVMLHYFSHNFPEGTEKSHDSRASQRFRDARATSTFQAP